jgi:hypothetical protein
MGAGFGTLLVLSGSGQPIAAAWPLKNVNASWARNAFGALTFKVPMGRKSQYRNGVFRLLELVEYHDSRLPYVWVGVITRIEPQGGEAQITCQSAEWLFYKRYTDQWVQALGTGSQIVQLLYNQATRNDALPIRMGDLDMGGQSYYIEYSLKRISDAFSELVGLTGGDLWVEKLRQSGNAPGALLSNPWMLRYDRRRGRDLSGKIALAGSVADTPQFGESADQMATALYTIGGGYGSELWQRLFLYRRGSIDARRTYGYLEETEEYSDVIDLDLLTEGADRSLAVREKPQPALGLNIDNRFGQFGTFWIGDTVRALISDIKPKGLDARVIVTGIQLDADNGKMGLTVEEIG